MVATGSGNAVAYDVFVALHVLCAVVGFGSVAISGVYGALATRPDGDGTTEETDRYFASPGRAEFLILLVPVFGLAALGLKAGGGSDLAEVWVVGGLIAWFAAASLLLGVIRPAERRIREARDVRSASRLMWAAVVSDVLFVVALALMVTQPA